MHNGTNISHCQDSIERAVCLSVCVSDESSKMAERTAMANAPKIATIC